eukprot:481738_1
MVSLMVYLLVIVSNYWLLTQSKTCNITDYGAKGDGKTDNIKAIQSAINDCSKASNNSLVVLPRYYSNGAETVYLSSALWLQSNIEFHIEKNVVLLAMPCTNQSANNISFPWIYTRYNGIMMFHPASILNGGICESINYNSSAIGDQCIKWKKLKNIKISGKGIINGNGHSGWHYQPFDQNRPCLLDLLWINNLEIVDITVTNSPAWTVHPTFCSNVIIDHITVITDDHNSDGIDPDSCNNVLIQNCDISTGDDCIAIKSGRDADGRAVGIPCNNVTVRNITTRNGGGIAIGSEMSGNITNVLVDNIFAFGTKNGPYIKSAPCRGGMVKNITFSNFVLENVETGMSVTKIRNDCGNETNDFPIIKDIYFINITGTTTKSAGSFTCLEQSPCYDIDLKHIDITSAQNGFDCQYVHGTSNDVQPKSCIDSLL